MKVTNFFKTVSISCLTIVGCSLSSVAQVLTPDSNWNIKSTLTDCSGTTSYTVAESSDDCQSYSSDIYENWDAGGNGAGDTDIATFSVGSDDEFFYFQQDLRENWNYDGTGESKAYHIDLDADFASGGDPLSDFLVVYKPLTTHVGNTWTAEGGSKVELYEDTNNDLGGQKPYSSDWDCGSNCDGISTPISLSSSDAYVRIVNGNIEIAIRRSVFGLPNRVRARAWATQTSTLDKSKHFFHDRNSSSDLASNRMDNTASANTSKWQYLGTNTVSSGAIELTYFASQIQCGADSSLIDVRVDVYHDRELLKTLSLNDSILVPITSLEELTFQYNFVDSQCSPTTPTAMILGTQDTVPNLPGAYDQDSIQQMLDNLNDYEELFLVELGTTNFNSSAYDLQDVVLVINNNPSSQYAD